MQYWHDILTEKSWNVLQNLKKDFDFILIGGWAVYLWTRALKSKDIDIIVDFNFLEKIKKKYNLKKNDNLKKYEIIVDEIDIDIYVAHYSKLALPFQKIESSTTMIEGFKVVQPEILLILKQGAELNRKDSEKGEKDKIDIISLLLNADIDLKKYLSLAPENYRKRLIEIIKTFNRLEFVNMNVRQYKLKKIELLKKLK